MPTLKHVSASGDNKRVMAALAPGQHVIAKNFGHSTSLRSAAKYMGLKVRVTKLGQPDGTFKVMVCEPAIP